MNEKIKLKIKLSSIESIFDDAFTKEWAEMLELVKPASPLPPENPTMAFDEMPSPEVIFLGIKSFLFALQLLDRYLFKNGRTVSIEIEEIKLKAGTPEELNEIANNVLPKVLEAKRTLEAIKHNQQN